MDATHTHTCYTLREICNHVLEGKKKKKPEKVVIVASFEGDGEKAQYSSFKHIFL